LKSENASEEFKKADALYNDGSYADALEMLDVLDAAYPDTKNILYARARCLAKLGETSKAIALCEMCIEQWDAPRAQELLEQLGTVKNITDKTSLPDINDLNMDSGLSAAFSAPRVKQGKRRKPNPALLTIAIVGVISIAWALHFAWMSYSFGSGVDVTEKEVKIAKGERAKAKKKQADIEDGPSREPGKIIPESVWMRTAVLDLPAWKPGKYIGVPCPGAGGIIIETGEELKRTIDVYIPMAYQEKPDDVFPAVIINWSSANPGFIGLENWAEKNEVVLVAINLVANIYYSLNWKTQDAALATIVGSIRLDLEMGFAIGMSGGAATSWEMICRYPENFAGVVMMGISDGHNDCWIPKHVRVAYIYGQTDHNIRRIQWIIPKMRSAGYKVRDQMVPGGHVTGPLHVREEMLTWMLADARRERTQRATAAD
jgi:Tetratricopeptide repeat